MDAPSTVSVRKATPVDSAAVTALHLDEIPWGLLSSMGPRFVESFYRTLLGSELGFGFLAEREGRPIGYATGVVHWRRFYRAFVMRNCLVAGGVLLRQALNLRRWRRLFETTRYAGAATLPDAELLSIAVSREARGTGAADALVREVLAEFARRGVTRVRVTTAPDNVAAARVYERSGFHLLRRTEIHPGEGAHLYVITLEDGRVSALSADRQHR